MEGVHTTARVWQLFPLQLRRGEYDMIVIGQLPDHGATKMEA